MDYLDLFLKTQDLNHKTQIDTDISLGTKSVLCLVLLRFIGRIF